MRRFVAFAFALTLLFAPAAHAGTVGASPDEIVGPSDVHYLDNGVWLERVYPTECCGALEGLAKTGVVYFVLEPADAREQIAVTVDQSLIVDPEKTSMLVFITYNTLTDARYFDLAGWRVFDYTATAYAKHPDLPPMWYPRLIP